LRHHDQPTKTIAILGADTVVGGALCALLGDHGYFINPLDAHPTGVVDELLGGADLLLLVPRLDKGAREAFLSAMGKGAPQTAEVPVIELSTALGEGLPEKEGGNQGAVAVRDEGPRGSDRSRPRRRGVRGCRGHLREGASQNGSRPSSRGSPTTRQGLGSLGDRRDP
jgi:hypothetical protein